VTEKSSPGEVLPFFNRQERIAWWNQERLLKARILVVGAGALGNEVLKNLALLGVGYLFVVDFDTIEDSNLSRAVLFRTADAVDGAKKAIIAAERAKALNPNPDAGIQALHGDVVWELGSGLYRHVDLVLGCLDNLEARIAVNLNCWYAGVPWIDGGLWELSGSVDVYDSTTDRACYECSMTPEHYLQAKIRYSCTNQTVKARLQQGYAPTTQTISAVVAAIQCQEAVKLLHGLPTFAGHRLVFNGDSHFYINPEFSPISFHELPINPDCLCHGEERYKVIELPAAGAKQTTARQLVEMTEKFTKFNIQAIELGREFVIQSVCDQCGNIRKINRPLYRTQDIDVVCPECKIICPSCGAENYATPDCTNCGQSDISEPRLEKFHTLFMNDQTYMQAYLDYTLYELGIPPLHVLKLISHAGEPIWVELTGDFRPNSPKNIKADNKLGVTKIS
jgi:adenylyltransferase/sulfurtransferase